MIELIFILGFTAPMDFYIFMLILFTLVFGGIIYWFLDRNGVGVPTKNYFSLQVGLSLLGGVFLSFMTMGLITYIL